MMKKKLYSILTLVPLFGIISCAPMADKKQTAQINSKIEVLESRVISLEKKSGDLENLVKQQDTTHRQKLSKKTKALQKSQLFFISEMERLKKDIEILTAENEKLAKQIIDNKKRLKRIRKDSGEILITVDQINTYFQEKLTSPAAKVAEKSPSAGKKNVHSEKIFRDIFKLFKENKIKKAGVEFNQFRKYFPKSKWADDALFYVGYIHLLNKKYDLATISFFELEKYYPKSDRIAEVKWWLAVALEKSGDIGAAIDVYGALVKLSGKNRFSEKAKRRLEELTDTGMSDE